MKIKIIQYPIELYNIFFKIEIYDPVVSKEDCWNKLQPMSEKCPVRDLNQWHYVLNNMKNKLI
jgi:hypothetical protein